MKKFLVRITETLEKTVEVDAENELDAVSKVQDLYNKAEVVLDDTDYVGVDIDLEKELN